MSSEIIGELGQVGLRISEGHPSEESSSCSEIPETQVVQVIERENKKRSPKANQFNSYRAKKFRSEWMSNEIFKDWLKPHTCPEFAVCTACNRTIKAGKSELEKHASGKKHLKMLKLGSGLAESGNTTPTETHTPGIVLVNQDPQQNYTETTFVVNLAGDYKGENGGEGTGYASSNSSQYVEVTQYEATPAQVQATTHSQPNQAQVATIVESGRTSVCSNDSKSIILTAHHSPEPQITTQPSLAAQLTLSPLEHHVMKPAPHWKATAVVNGHVTSLDLNDYRGRYLIMFFYTHDFCRVSCSEVNSVSDAMTELRSLGAEAVACSVDSYLCHLTWCKMTRLENGVQGTKVALLSDPTHTIAKNYGVYQPDKGHALRSCFIIDKRSKIRHVSINDPCIGRGTGELIRLLRAIQHNDRTEEVCLADWKPSD